MRSYSDFINQRARETNKCADGGANIVMKHTHIQGELFAMPREYGKESDRQRAERTGLGSLEITDKAAAAVQKSPHRISLEEILARISHVDYEHPSRHQHMTLAIVTLDNGYIVVGKSTPADPENFDAELGKKFAREDAIRQIWPLLAFSLREKLSLPGAFNPQETRIKLSHEEKVQDD
jgi:Phage protein (N4 Gp49/phage Sf6 gene 66) family